MRYSKPLAGAAFVALLFSSACDTDRNAITAADPEDAFRQPPQAQPQRSWNSDEEFARAARNEVPGFAGYYLTDDGTPVIRLVDDGQQEAAERYLARDFEIQREVRGRALRRPVFRGAEFDFAQLKDWSDALHPLVERGDVFTFDVDEVENRVRIGVRDQAAMAAVRTEALRLGMPVRALHVETEPAPEPRISLRDRTTALQGGYQIAFGSGLCTMGFNAVRNGVTVFVTNSHCTPTYFGSDGGALYQHTVASGNHVGNEIADRGLYACISGVSACRRSDSAIIQHNGSRTVNVGVIAKSAWNIGGPGGLTVTGQYTVTARYTGSTPVGTWLDKTGRTSGTTYGQVTASCVTIGNLRCQDVSKVWSQPGDSGSPVYIYVNATTAHLYGILWGGPGSDYTTTYSSRLSGIEADLGALSQVCAPGYGC